MSGEADKLEKKARVSVLGKRKIAIEIPKGVMRGIFTIKPEITIGDLFKFLSAKDSKEPGRILGIGPNDETQVQKKPEL